MKRTLAMILGLVLVLSMVFAQGALAAEKTVITYWNGFTGPDGPVLQELVDKYNQTNTLNVEIQMEIMPWDSLWQKLSTVLPAGEGPDIIAFSTERIGTYATPGALAELDEVYANGIVDASVIAPAYNENLKFNDKYYAVPMNIATLLMYYNKDMFAAAGLDPEAPPKTWAELQEYALKLTTADQYGFGMATSETIAMWPVMIWGGGGDIVKDGQSVLNSQENIDTFTNWSKFIKENKTAPLTMTGGEIDKLFESQKLAMYFCGPWATGGFAAAGVNFGVAAPPVGPAGDVTLGTAVAMVMTKSSENKEAVYDFFKYWNSPDTQIAWSLGTGFPLARTDLLDDPRIADSEYIKAFSAVSPTAKFYLQQLTNYGQVEAEGLVPALETIMLTDADIKATLDEAAATIEMLIG